MGDNDWVKRSRLILEGPRKGVIITERVLAKEVRAEDRHIINLEEIERRYRGCKDFSSQIQKSQEIFRENLDFNTERIQLAQERFSKMVEETNEKLRKMRQRF